MHRVDGVRGSLWRALAVFRIAALVVAIVLIVKWHGLYAHAAIAWVTAAAMVAITVLVVALALSGRAHRPWLVALDVVVTAGLTALSRLAQTPDQYHGGMVTLTTVWAAGPTIEAALVAGAASGVAAALVQYLVTAGVADSLAGRTLYSGVLLVLTGGVVGLVTTYAVRAEDELRIASSTQAALAERERLARSIHDGVLQVLGLVHRSGRDAGEPWAALATEAGRQEAALRALLTSQLEPAHTTRRDLCAALRALQSGTVTVSVPAGAVVVDPSVADELVAAVNETLTNVARHAGPAAHAWVLLESIDGTVAITVRDDGLGFAPARLAEAEREGRLGVPGSIRGRVAGLGGNCAIHSVPGEGTTVELVIPS